MNLIQEIQLGGEDHPFKVLKPKESDLDLNKITPSYLHHSFMAISFLFHQLHPLLFSINLFPLHDPIILNKRRKELLFPIDIVINDSNQNLERISDQLEFGSKTVMGGDDN